MGASSAVAAALLVVPASGGASGAVAWEPGTFADPGGTLVEAMTRMVVDDDGDRHVVYRNSEFEIVLVEIPAGGAPESPIVVFDGVTASGIYPEVAVDSQDRVTVVWQANGAGNPSVMARTVAADGSLGTAWTLSDSEDVAYEPQLAVDGAGIASVVWPVEGGFGVADDVLQMRRFDVGSEAEPGPVITLDAPKGIGPDFAAIRDPDIALDAQDRLTVVWVRDDGGPGSARSVRALRVAADGSPGPTRLVSDAATVDLDYPEVVVGPDGAATVAYTGYSPASQTWVNRLTAADGSPGTPVVVSAPTTSSIDDPALAVDPQGRTTVVWQTTDGSVHTRRVAGDGSLESARPPLGTIGTTLPRLDMIDAAADSEGRVTVAFIGDDPTGSRPHAVRVEADGTRSTTHRLGRAGEFDEFGEFVEVATDPVGRATVAWILDGAVRVRRTGAPGSTVAADTQIVGGPAEGSVTNDSTPTFAMEADTVEAMLECRLGQTAPWSVCGPSYTPPSALRPGLYTFQARATDADGTGADATPAVRSFTIEALPTTGPSRVCRQARIALIRATLRLKRVRSSSLPPRVKRAEVRVAEQKVVRAKRVVRRAC
jgi:hypothetical protein